ncbi:MAG TPA: NAD(+)/NADH kinase [Polyangiaceae bacterium]|nr:NAD(+)/NADH kinase [Polyangiaceae bacterium]
MSGPRVVLVVKKTPYSRYVEDERDPEVRRLVKKKDPSVAVWVSSHREHVVTLAVVERALKALGARVWKLQAPRAVFDASDAALVVTVGGDGTLLAASHHVGATPILGVNSSPHSSVGFFCASRRANAEAMLARALDGKMRAIRLARMQVEQNGRVISKRVLNEALFSHETPAAASRYVVAHAGHREEQVSSGFWVGTAAGSTGALHSAGGDILPLGSRRLEFVVREPFAGGGWVYDMTKLFCAPGKSISVTSKMREACLFLDGPFLRTTVRLGDRLGFSLSDDPLNVLGLSADRGRGD